MSQDETEMSLDQRRDAYKIYLQNLKSGALDYLISQLVTLEKGVIIDDTLVDMILDRDPTGRRDDCYQEME